MKKLIFTSICLIISITISISTFNLSKNQNNNVTLNSLFVNANAGDIEQVDVTCSQGPGACWAFSTYMFMDLELPCCTFSGYMSNSCTSHPPC